MASNIEIEVTAHSTAGEYAYGSAQGFGRTCGTLDCFPCAFQKLSMLRGHDGRLPAAKSEEICIEHFHAAEVGGSSDIVFVAQLCFGFTGCQEFFVRERTNGLNA